MMRATPQADAASASRYFRVADYYGEGHQETMGDCAGGLAERLGLPLRLTHDQFRALCYNKNPLTSTSLTARTRADRTVGMDFTFDGPKAFGVLWALADEELRGKLDRAFRLSVEETLREMEAEALTRVRQGGADENRLTGNLLWVIFWHSTGRGVADAAAQLPFHPDMQPHAHGFCLNATWDEQEQQIKAVQFRLKRDAPYFEAAFHERLAGRLAALGFDITRKGKKDWDVAGFPADLARKFSRRTEQIDQAAAAKEAELGRPLRAEEKARLGAQTRQRKAKEFTMDELRGLWVSRLTAQDQAALDGLQKQAQAQGPRPPRANATEAVDFALDHCFERVSAAPVKQLLTEALRYGVGGVGVDAVKKELRSRGLITAEIEGRAYATTRELLAEERRLMATASSGRATRAPIRPHHEIRRTILNPGQRAAVHHLLGFGGLVTIVLGGAGVGKTELVKEAVEAAREAGHGVRAFAPSVDASRGTLREAGFEDAETVAMLLKSERLQAECAGQVWVVDEAGMLGTKDMAKLVDLAKALGARLWLLGDPAQHGSIPYGSPLRLLTERAGITPAKVTEIVRQTDPGYKQAAALARDGKPQESFDALEAKGWVREGGDGERYRLLAEAYVAAVAEKKKNGQHKTALVVSPTHAEGARVTEEIRAALKQAGRIEGEERGFLRLVPAQLTEAQRRDQYSYQPGDVLQFHQNVPGYQAGRRVAAGTGPLPLAQAARFQVYHTGAVRLAKGDRIRITAPGKTLDGAHRLTNGSEYTVAGFTEGGNVRLDNGWVLGKEFGHWNHAYCVTSFASQSRTVDKAILAMSSLSQPATNRETYYVAMSRARERVQIVTDDKEALRTAIARGGPRLHASDVADRAAAARRIRRHAELLRRLALRLRGHAIHTLDRVRPNLTQMEAPSQRGMTL